MNKHTALGIILGLMALANGQTISISSWKHKATK